jgi:drug/metabolite transporter (DMT)-like permease
MSRSAPTSHERTALVAALLTLYLVWGSTYLAIRVVVEVAPPLLSTAARFLAAGALLAAVLVARGGRARLRTSGHELRAATLVGGLVLVGGIGLLGIAEQHVPSGVASLVIASVPLWVVLLRAARRERVPRRTLAGVLAGFAGVGTLVLPGAGTETGPAWGLALLVAAAVATAAGSVLADRVGLPPDVLLATTLEMLTAGVLLAAVGLVVGEGADLDAGAVSLEAVLAFAYLVVIGSVVAYTAFVWLLDRAPVSTVSTYAYVNPIVAVALGWALLDEAVGPRVLLAAAIIVGGVAVTVRAEPSAEHRRPAGEGATEARAPA